jgi:hypothetical protein
MVGKAQTTHPTCSEIWLCPILTVNNQIPLSSSVIQREKHLQDCSEFYIREYMSYQALENDSSVDNSCNKPGPYFLIRNEQIA